MYGYRTFLKIGDTQSLDFGNLLQSGYELSSFSYALEQPTDLKGKAQGEVQGGTMQLTFSGFPSGELLDWMMSHHRLKSGIFVIFDTNNQSASKIIFETARCIAMNIRFINMEKGFMSVQMTINAKKVILPDQTEIDSNWKNH